jgi:CRP/FNR family cyclic AMP-dependent transcriptional regulator
MQREPDQRIKHPPSGAERSGGSQPSLREAIGNDAKREALRSSRLFQVLQPAELESMAARATLRRFPRHSVVVRKGDASAGMAVILAGRARVGSVAPDGREVTLAVLGPGEVLGEIALLDGEPRSADVTALDDCVMLMVDRGEFLRLLHGNPDLCLRLMVFLCGRLRRANAAVEEMALLDLPGRLANVLLRLSRDYGRIVPQGTRIELKLSQKDLSTLIGGSREKVNRQLRVWEVEGVLGRDGGRIVLRQPDRLAASE